MINVARTKRFGRTAPKPESKKTVADKLMEKVNVNATDPHLLELLAKGEIGAYDLLTKGTQHFSVMHILRLLP